MAIPSANIELGMIAPNFNLLNVVSNKMTSLEQIISDKATVVMFICNHCPYVKHINKEVVNLANDYLNKGISFAAISSNDVVNYPEDSPEKMKELAEQIKLPFPYLYDETQETAKAYGAECTPDIYVFNKDLELVYHGQFDDSRPGNNKPVTGNDLRNALNSIIEGKPVFSDQIPSIGCSIKWKK